DAVVGDGPARVGRLDVVLLPVCLAGRGAFPHAPGRLVPAHVDVAQGHARVAVDRHQVLDDALDERVRGGQRWVDDVVVVVLRRGVARAVVRVAQQEALRAGRVARLRERARAGLHGLDGGARVARHLDLRDDLDVPRGRV